MKTNSETIAKHIWHEILQKSSSPFKWNFDLPSVKAIRGGTSFRINSPFVTGRVTIKTTTGCTYDIAIKPDTFYSSLTFRGLAEEEVIPTLDAILLQGRLCENYKFQEIAEAV